jgi:ELWxxDGT repeat protein
MTARDTLFVATMLMAALAQPALADDDERECGPPLAVVSAAQGLISTDGTTRGTAVLAPPSLGGFAPVVAIGDGVGLTHFNSLLSRWELYVTDGAPGGAYFVTSLQAASLFSNIDSAAHVINHVVFSFTDGAEPGFGLGLWTTDGTAAGTVQIAGVDNPSDLVHDAAFLADGRLVFVSANGLEVTDGTVAGTQLLAPAFTAFNPNQNGTMASLGGTVLFGAANFGSGRNGVNQVWRTDGTPAGTMPIFNLPGDALDFSPPQFASLGSKALISYNGIVAASDGTAGGTPVLPGITFPSVTQTVVLDGRAIFPAHEGLVITDGTPAGTALLKAAGSGSTVFVAAPPTTNMAVLDHEVIFPAADGTVTPFGATSIGAINQLWRTDGTPAGTRKIADLPMHDSSSQILGLLTVGDRVLISYSDNGNNAILSTDGRSITRVLEHATTDVAFGQVVACSPPRGE